MNTQDYYPFHVFVHCDDGRIRSESENMPYIDLYWLNKVFNEYKKPGMVAYEIGSWTGMSTCCIGSVVKECGGKMVAIDNFSGASDNQREYVRTVDVKELLENNIKRFGLQDCVEMKNCNSNDCYEEVPDEYIDFLFIDGDHRYDQVKKDLDNWVPKVKEGGIICGHDYDGLSYDEEHVNKDFHNDRHHGVIKAVSERFGSMVRFMVFRKDDTQKIASKVWFNIKGETDG